MAEARRSLNQESSLTPPASDPDVERLHEDIAQRREQIAGNLGELRDRLSPSRVMHEAADRVKGAAAEARGKVATRASETAGRVAERAQSGARAATRQVQSHPLGSGAALAGAGAAWWLLSSRRHRSRGHPLTAAHVDRSRGSAWLWPALAAAGVLAASQSPRVRQQVSRDRVAAAGRTVREAASSLRHRAQGATAPLTGVPHVPAYPWLAGAATLLLGLAVGLGDRERESGFAPLDDYDDYDDYDSDDSDDSDDFDDFVG